MYGLNKNKVDMYKRIVSLINDFPEIKENPEINKHIDTLSKVIEHLNILFEPTETETQNFIDRIALLKTHLINSIIPLFPKLHELSKLKKDIKLKELTSINKGQLFNLLNNDLINRAGNILLFAVKYARYLKSMDIQLEYIACCRKSFDEFKTYNNLYNKFKMSPSSELERIKTILFSRADENLNQIDFVLEEFLEEDDEFYELYIKQRDLQFDYFSDSEEEKHELIEID